MTVFSNGGPPITADNLNQFVQAFDTVADLRGQIGAVTSAGIPQQVSLQGFTAPGDGGQGVFYWNAISTAADDSGVTTVVPLGSTQGAWIRIANKLQQASGAGNNGFVTLPGGLIMQWGIAQTATSGSVGAVTVNWPIVFPHSADSVVATAAGAVAFVTETNFPSPTGVSGSVFNTYGSGFVAMGGIFLSWFAIGH